MCYQTQQTASRSDEGFGTCKASKWTPDAKFWSHVTGHVITWTGIILLDMKQGMKYFMYTKFQVNIIRKTQVISIRGSAGGKYENRQIFDRPYLLNRWFVWDLWPLIRSGIVKSIEWLFQFFWLSLEKWDFFSKIAEKMTFFLLLFKKLVFVAKGW